MFSLQALTLRANQYFCPRSCLLGRGRSMKGTNQIPNPAPTNDAADRRPTAPTIMNTILDGRMDSCVRATRRWRCEAWSADTSWQQSRRKNLIITLHHLWYQPFCLVSIGTTSIHLVHLSSPRARFENYIVECASYHEVMVVVQNEKSCKRVECSACRAESGLFPGDPAQ
jgi:hypothetical protein